MTPPSKPLAVMIFAVIFGGIALSSLLGWWQTESTKHPAKFLDGEFAGQANPADIRGSYTFGDIKNSFEVSPRLLAEAFRVTTDDPASFAVKDLKLLYLDSGVEVGTNSVRLFVAYSLGLPFDTTGQEIYLPVSAANMLLETAPLTSDQQAYLLTHTVYISPTSDGDGLSAPKPEVATDNTEDYAVKGKTLFGDLIAWGVPQEVIEQIIGAPMPDPAMKVKDFVIANGLSFETIKTQIQEEVDKVK